MEDVIKLHDQHYILASEARLEERTRVLKDGDTFAIFDRFGDVRPIGLGEQGIFHEDTRYLSALQVRIAGARPLLLSSTVTPDNDVLIVDLTNADVLGQGDTVLQRSDIHVLRTKFLWDAACYERLRVTNYSLIDLTFDVSVQFDADFADIFEVRGAQRPARGTQLAARVGAAEVALAYRGLDHRTRTTTLRFDPAPATLGAAQARWSIRVPPRQAVSLSVTVQCSCTAEEISSAPPLVSYADAHRRRVGAEPRAPSAEVVTTNEGFNAWLRRARADIRMMVTRTVHGPYPYAGVPWFSTPFGRDGIITALQTLWLEPDLARGVLTYLGATQASERDAARDAEPGKILHERRGGEMAALDEIPFGLYYGSVDATPLYVALAGAYYDRTGDLAFVAALWPTLERALAWIDGPGDPDGDGFVEYAGRSVRGLANQGWKDSTDSISHADGTLAHGPIALCEVQAYVYAARLAAARIADALGRDQIAARLRARAAELREAFARAFFVPELDAYALALDGDKRPCRVRSSNSAHCLFTGIAHEDHARRIVATLFDDDLFSGWGVRTLSTSAPRYNPMSYHNGSVWPHDNALIAAGLARLGFQQLACRLLAAHFDAGSHFDLRRMPELFCGFQRREGEGPTGYPVACAPQAWAAGAVFQLLSSCLGLSLDASRHQVRLESSALPDCIASLRLQNLSVGGATLDLLFDRHPHDVGVTVLRRDQAFNVTVLK